MPRPGPDGSRSWPTRTIVPASSSTSTSVVVSSVSRTRRSMSVRCSIAVAGAPSAQRGEVREGPALHGFSQAGEHLLDHEAHLLVDVLTTQARVVEEEADVTQVEQVPPE